MARARSCTGQAQTHQVATLRRSFTIRTLGCNANTKPLGSSPRAGDATALSFRPTLADQPLETFMKRRVLLLTAVAGALMTALPAFADEPIKIGLIAPFSGPFAPATAVKHKVT